MGEDAIPVFDQGGGFSDRKPPAYGVQTGNRRQQQSHETRRRLFEEIEASIGRPLVTYFTSFNYQVMIDDNDANMLEGVLQDLDLSNGLALMISTPGGNGLAAERIINVCRNYSGTGEYQAIVPGRAKSAGTVICLGASRIVMGRSAELGPIDPQWSPRDSTMAFSLPDLVEGYDELFATAVAATGRLEPYLQQLSHYDAREVKQFRSLIDLSEDIVVRALKTGMMKDESEKDICRRMKLFLDPKATKTHGRAIYFATARECGLTIEEVDPKSDIWGKLYELHVRSDNFVSTSAAKCIESKEGSFAVGAPSRD